MKQVERSDDRLVFEQRPTVQRWFVILLTVVFAVIGIVLFARQNDIGVLFLVFAVSGPVFIYFFVETRSIIFDRPGGTVTLRREGMRGVQDVAHTLEGAVWVEVHRATPDEAARVLAADDTPPDGGVFRPVLAYKDGTSVPLTEDFAKGRAPFELARAINGWLNG